MSEEVEGRLAVVGELLKLLLNHELTKYIYMSTVALRGNAGNVGQRGVYWRVDVLGALWSSKLYLEQVARDDTLGHLQLGLLVHWVVA